MAMRSRAYWAALVERHAGSGLTGAEFCRREGVDNAQFYAWKSKLKLAAKSESSKSLVPVTVVPATTVEVVFPCGAIMKMPAFEGAIRPLVRGLLERGDDAER